MNGERPLAITPITLFYSYVDQDEDLRVKLEIHLSLLQQQGMITSWDHQKIMPGAEFQQVNEDHLAAAQLILFLISPDFLASHAAQAEIQRALPLQQTGWTQIIPLLLRPVDCNRPAFAHLQLLPRTAQP